MMQDIHNIRKDYSLKSLDESDTLDDPMNQFSKWFKEAVDSQAVEANAMVLSTMGENGFPSSRVVLLKGLSESGFRFFTNYESRKGRELQNNPKAALNFFWPELERQVRIVGLVSKTEASISDEYFKSRPLNSRVGAWASPQSQQIPDRKWLENMETEIKSKLGVEELQRPEFWGGYELKPHEIEFWQGRPSRLHDRILYQKSEDVWTKKRLAP
ncbi:MAG: pyridoxamine 5'-phosphate oxidase [Cytophagales bacterium]